MISTGEKDESLRNFDELARYFFLLSDPTRLRILSSLCNGERTVGEVVNLIGLTQANISRHLSLLLSAKVVARRREGSCNFYHVVDPNFVDICQLVWRTEKQGNPSCMQ